MVGLFCIYLSEKHVKMGQILKPKFCLSGIKQNITYYISRAEQVPLDLFLARGCLKIIATDESTFYDLF